MITVGLDFGTHQTKVCIEDREGVELNYKFMRFEDTYHRPTFTLPSVIGVGKDGLLTYGYLPYKYEGRIIRYFKQSAFCPSKSGMVQINALYFSTWYIAYLLFDLERMYGQDFNIQMGAPTDSSHVTTVKQIATRIIASAYRLVEEVFHNDKESFLATPMRELVERTIIEPYSKEIKDEYGLLVFPEAYACLKPLIRQGKLERGMNLMIDIGGGTTDISFFTIEKDEQENNIPQVYDFFSLNKGLNFLTRANDSNRFDTTVNVQNADEIDGRLRVAYINEINQICDGLKIKLQNELKKQTRRSLRDLEHGLKNRPLVYCGGGSSFKSLRVNYGGFKDKKLISHTEWNTKSITDIDYIIEDELCPILSTAYGLAIYAKTDDIVMKPLCDIFKHIRNDEDLQSHGENLNHNFGKAYGGFSYTDDWSAWK